MRTLLLDALACKNVNRPPVWLMRQAGRYMPQYRALREKHSLYEMFHEPELAAQVTLLPMQLLDVDAAILFSDILVIAEALGLQVEFPDKGGPRVVPAIQTKKQVEALALVEVQEALHYVFETIALVKNSLSVPLIGFCGGPFTVATYFTGRAKEWIATEPVSFHLLLEKITAVSIAYLKAQIAAGVHAVQIFDSWANILTDSEFMEFCTPYLSRMIQAIKKDVPVIVFCRDSSIRYAQLAALEPTCISFDWHLPMAELRERVPASIAVQGNIAPELLKQPKDEIQKHLENLLSSMQGEKGYIVNLGHGVLPDIPFEHVRHFVDVVKNFQSKMKRDDDEKN